MRKFAKIQVALTVSMNGVVVVDLVVDVVVVVLDVVVVADVVDVLALVASVDVAVLAAAPDVDVVDAPDVLANVLVAIVLASMMSFAMAVLDVVVDVAVTTTGSSRFKPTSMTTTATIAPTATKPNDIRHILTNFPHLMDIDQAGSASLSPILAPAPLPPSTSTFRVVAILGAGAGA